MKKIVFLLVFSCVVFCVCAQTSPYLTPKSPLPCERGLVERVAVGQSDAVKQLQDSIRKLNARPVMTAEQFVKLYKYERLERYYRICKRKPSQWKYYKGWSTRVFENK